MNTYRGCTHGCIYCDSRSKCYQINHDFEDIEVKKDAAQILDMQLSKRRNRSMVGTGSMCDPYIPLENELCVTKNCLEVINKHEFGVYLLTKSSRILRDLPLLEEINKKTKCVVGMTLTTLDENLCKIIEPNVSSTLERYKTLKTIRKAGIETIVWLTPILPYLNDTEENLRGLLDFCFDIGVAGIVCFGFGLTMREGNREYLYKKFDLHFNGLKEQYIRDFGEKYECDRKNSSKLMKIFKNECIKRGILSTPKDVFDYVQKFETKSRQLSFFDM
jgi:DNA repair photolyase